MSLGEYKSRGAADTRLLLHLNGNATDSSGNGNNGTDAWVTYVNGRLGKYASFSGTSDFGGTYSYIQVPNHSSLNIGDAITVSVWFNTHKESGSSYIVSKWGYDMINNKPSRQYKLDIIFNTLLLRNYLNFSINRSSGQIDVTDNKACETNIWKYVTGVYDGSTLKLYVDGVLKKTVIATGEVGGTNNDIGIGCHFNRTTPSDQFIFKGYIDEIIIEGRAWSYSEIKRYYTNTLGKFATI